jgi:hypothetical protein
MKRRLLFGAAVGALACGAAMLGMTSAAVAGNGTPTGGAHTQSETVHFQAVYPIGNGVTNPVDPCDPTQTLSGTFTASEIDHMTWFPNDPSQFWSTSTDEGTVNATSIPGGVTYSGHETSWFGLNSNQNNAEGGGTMTIIARGSDGTTIQIHEVGHFFWTGQFDSSGNPIIIRGFDTKSVTCG